MTLPIEQQRAKRSEDKAPSAPRAAAFREPADWIGCKAFNCSVMRCRAFRWPPRSDPLHLRSASSARWHAPARQRDRAKLIVQLACNFLAFDILQRDDALQTPLDRQPRCPGWPPGDSTCRKCNEFWRAIRASPACHNHRLRFSSLLPTAFWIGAGARLTTCRNEEKNDGITVPICS